MNRRSASAKCQTFLSTHNITAAAVKGVYYVITVNIIIKGC